MNPNNIFDYNSLIKKYTIISSSTFGYCFSFFTKVHLVFFYHINTVNNLYQKSTVNHNFFQKTFLYFLSKLYSPPLKDV